MNLRNYTKFEQNQIDISIRNQNCYKWPKFENHNTCDVYEAKSIK